MKTPHKNAEILMALAEGKEVQFKFETSCWITWNQSHESPLDTVDTQGWKWRIKPEPKPDTVYFAVISSPNDFLRFISAVRYSTDNLMLTFSGETGKLIKAKVI